MWEGAAQGTGVYLCIMDKDQRAQVFPDLASQGFTSHDMGSSLGPPPGRPVYKFVVMMK